MKDLIAAARETDRPAWDLITEDGLVHLRWAGPTSERVQGLPLGTREATAQQLADKLGEWDFGE